MVAWEAICLKRFYSTSLDKKLRMLLPSYIKPLENTEPTKKMIRVALVGFTNAGKSTLINSVLGLHLCPVSKRPLTTKEYQKVTFVRGDTKIIFVDTPGILSEKLKKVSPFTPSEEIIQKRVGRNIDIIGLIVDSASKYSRFKIRDHLKLLQSFFPKDADIILILNKVDKLKDKVELLTLAKKYHNISHSTVNEDINDQDAGSNKGFSQVFMTSALKKDGVEFLVKYFVSKAYEIREELNPKKITNHGDAEVIQNRVRASLLEYFKEEVPYQCLCELEHLSESDDGILYIIVVVRCPSKRVFNVLDDPELQKLVIKDCTSDFTKIFKKNVSLRLNFNLDKSVKLSQ